MEVHCEIWKITGIQCLKHGMLLFTFLKSLFSGTFFTFFGKYLLKIQIFTLNNNFYLEN